MNTPDSSTITAQGAQALQADLLQPLDPERRIPALDVTRGVALLGIALMNIEFFTRPLQGIALGFDASLQGVDYVAGWLVTAFVQGKFWTLFSLLFGAGFALMLERADAAGGRFAGVYARRLLALFAIGVLHALLLWAGDILVPYAVGGFVLLLLFRRTPVRRLWRWGLVLYMLPVALLAVMAAGTTAARMNAGAEASLLHETQRAQQQMQDEYARAAPIYARGSYAEATAQRWRDTRQQWSWLPMLLPGIVGAFLLGAWLLRSGVLREPMVHRRLLRRLLWAGLPAGALLAVVAMPMQLGQSPFVPTPRLALGSALMAAANLLLCLGYLSALLLASGSAAAWLRRWIAPVGRMALSNYVLQSLLFASLFHGYGLGLWGQVPRAWQLGLVCVVFLLQVLLSCWWMRHFRHGPLEWLWRTMTYLRPPPMRLR